MNVCASVVAVQELVGVDTPEGPVASGGASRHDVMRYEASRICIPDHEL